MAVYKVLQDIEADDKLIGPLSLKQFIFAIIALGLLFIEFRIATATALGVARWPLIAVFLLPTAIFGVLASPLGGDQPTEIWLLARVRFYLKPRKRIWNQDGPKELVTITAPKQAEKILSKDFRPHEVRSRLDALANVMDSRGWAVKNINVNLSNSVAAVATNAPFDDRLVSTDSMPQEVATVDIQPEDDIMDEKNSYVAQNFENMIQQAEDRHRQQLREQIDMARNKKTMTDQGEQTATAVAAANDWFANQPAASTKSSAVPEPAVTTAPYELPTENLKPPVVQPVNAPSAEEEQRLLQQVHTRQAQPAASSSFAHLKTLNPLGQQSAAPTPAPQPVATQPQPPALDPAVTANLARDNDKTIATIARQAEKANPAQADHGEIVVKLR